MNRDLIVGGEAIPLAAADEEKKAKQTENGRRM
jgi:hypothetical protein